LALRETLKTSLEHRAHAGLRVVCYT